VIVPSWATATKYRMSRKSGVIGRAYLRLGDRSWTPAYGSPTLRVVPLTPKEEDRGSHHQP
jgi:hypothetical protein